MSWALYKNALTERDPFMNVASLEGSHPGCLCGDVHACPHSARGLRLKIILLLQYVKSPQYQDAEHTMFLYWFRVVDTLIFCLLACSRNTRHPVHHIDSPGFHVFLVHRGQSVSLFARLGCVSYRMLEQSRPRIHPAIARSAWWLVSSPTSIRCRLRQPFVQKNFVCITGVSSTVGKEVIFQNLGIIESGNIRSSRTHAPSKASRNHVIHPKP